MNIYIQVLVNIFQFLLRNMEFFSYKGTPIQSFKCLTSQGTGRHHYGGYADDKGL